MAKFKYNEAAENDPIRIEQVWAEKPAGGVVHVIEDTPATTPVAEIIVGAGYEAINGCVFIGQSGDDNILVENIFGVLVGKALFSGGKPVGKVLEIRKNPKDFELRLGGMTAENLPQVGEYLTTVPFINPSKYVTGHDLKAADGVFQPVRLINGANLRKETAVCPEGFVEGIHLV